MIQKTFDVNCNTKVLIGLSSVRLVKLLVVVFLGVSFFCFLRLFLRVCEHGPLGLSSVKLQFFWSFIVVVAVVPPSV